MDKKTAIDALISTLDNVAVLRTCIPGACYDLGLSNEQLLYFCLNTPNGEELWQKYVTKRDSDPSGEYVFSDFMFHIVAKTYLPIL